MNIRYRVDLSETERAELQAMLSGGRQAARTLKRAQILLAADAGVPDEVIATSIAVGGSTVYRTKRRFVEGNLDKALNEQPRPGVARKLTGQEEALLVATACSSPPVGRARWTLELLAGEMVRLTAHASLSRETVRRRLAENALKPWQQKMWCIPKIDGEYVARMENVLDLYAATPDPQHPVVCFDESPVQLIGETRTPIPAAPERVARVDYEYRRCGTVNLFVMVDAHRPWRHVTVSARRTTLRPACGSWLMCTTPRPSGSGWCWITSRRTRPDRSTKRFRSRGASHSTPSGVPLYSQARKLVEHDRDRNRGDQKPMPGPAH